MAGRAWPGSHRRRPTTAVTRTVLIATAGGASDRFAHTLRQAGHRALRAAGPTELMDAVTADPGNVDLLLLDAGLGDAPALVTRIRARTGSLPILVFSGSIASAGDVRALAAAGVDGYVNEHCDPERIVPALAPHLFPDSFNRRSTPRIALSIPVSYRVDQTITGALTLNVGQGGLAVRTMNPLAVSTRVHVRFRLPDTPRDTQADCRVAWADRRVGMGLQFERLDGADQMIIDEYVDRRDTARGRNRQGAT